MNIKNKKSIIPSFNDTQNTREFWSAKRQKVSLDILWSLI